MKTIVIALGGNALQKKGGEATAQAQLQVVQETATQLLDIVKAGWRMVIVHGNGPQVGRILLQNELSQGRPPPCPLMSAAP